MTTKHNPKLCDAPYNEDGHNANFDGPEYCDRRKGHKGDHQSHWTDRDRCRSLMVSWTDEEVS